MKQNHINSNSKIRIVRITYVDSPDSEQRLQDIADLFLEKSVVDNPKGLGYTVVQKEIPDE